MQSRTHSDATRARVATRAAPIVPSTAILLVLLFTLVWISGAQASETITLDTHHTTQGTTGATTRSAAPLVTGATYYVQVRGTVSIWPRSEWAQSGQICGAAEAAPLEPSPGIMNGPTGWDAETVFAVPPGAHFPGFVCQERDIPFRVADRSTGGLQFDFGAGFTRIPPIGGPYSTPRADHMYTYSVTGQGTPLGVKFADGPLGDNYGVFAATVLTSAECAARHCDGGTHVGASDPASASAQPVPSVQALSTTSHTCASRRVFTIHLRQPHGTTLKSATVKLNGKRVRVVRGARLRSIINLRGLPRGVFKVDIAATTTRGQFIRSTRTYHTCAPRKR